MENTMIHPETGEILYRDVRPIEFNYKGETITLDMPGWYTPEGDDGVYSMDDMAVHDKALRILKARHAKKLQEHRLEFDNAALA